MIYHLDCNSSFLEEIDYDEDLSELTIRIKYGAVYTYIDVPLAIFFDFTEVKSQGKYYLTIIKNNFKLKTMGERPKGINKAKNDYRYIKMSINVRKVMKEWIIAGQSGDYLAITLHLKPDGELDDFGNLGMVTQDPPKGSAKDVKGPILGNGFEFAPRDAEGQPGNLGTETISKEAMDDLPF